MKMNENIDLYLLLVPGTSTGSWKCDCTNIVPWIRYTGTQNWLHCRQQIPYNRNVGCPHVSEMIHQNVDRVNDF